jgi:hypothetical protein
MSFAYYSAPFTAKAAELVKEIIPAISSTSQANFFMPPPKV